MRKESRGRGGEVEVKEQREVYQFGACLSNFLAISSFVIFLISNPVPQFVFLSNQSTAAAVVFVSDSRVYNKNQKK